MKKNGRKHDLDANAVDKRNSKQDSHQCCGCSHGQHCSCALKKEHHPGPVPTTGLPSSQPPVLSELNTPYLLTTTKSQGTLTQFRDAHHKPAHKHNDMAHKCGQPYTIPRSHTFHSTSDVARRSVDRLPSSQTLMGESLSQRVERLNNVTQRLVRSEHGSPESVPLTALNDTTMPVPPLELASYVDSFPATSPSQPLEPSSDCSPQHASVPTSLDTLDTVPSEQIVTSVPPLDVSLSSFPTSNPSPTACVPFREAPYQDHYFASPDTDFSLSSAAFNAPPVDWSSFPFYSADMTAATSTQAPSYASLDYGSATHGLPAPSSSGDLSELEDMGPFPHDFSSGNEGSDFDHFRFSSASVGLPQTQLLASSNLESISLDDFLKSANASTAALEQQLQANIGMEQKSLPTQSPYAVRIPIPMATSPTDPVWSTALFDSAPTSGEENFLPQTWI